MKILLFTLEYPPFFGGVANYYGNLIKYWPEKNNITVLHNNNGLLLKNWLWPKWLPAVWRLWREVKKEKINHILVGHILPLGTAAYYVTKFSKTPYSVILHGMDFSYSQRTGRKKRIAKKILTNAKYIICANSYTADLVKKFLNKKTQKIIVVNPGIGNRVQCSDEKIQLLKHKYRLQNKFILFSLGRLVKRKGIDKVLEALPIVYKQAPNLIYIIAGDGPDKEYLHKKAEGIKKVIFLGKISDDEKWTWLNSCDTFIMPARNENGDFEGFGIVYLEANLAGKPVIAGDSGGARDAVRHGLNGLLVNPEDTELIAKAILELSNNKELRKKLGEQGRVRAVHQFSWPEKIKKIYYTITNH